MIIKIFFFRIQCSFSNATVNTIFNYFLFDHSKNNRKIMIKKKNDDEF